MMTSLGAGADPIALTFLLIRNRLEASLEKQFTFMP